ncbi:MAG: methylmalonyl-CoA epimerase [Alphaproteobacteria bacterium]|nr:methylmalonyl-CoA epimerase [Alphaproteobacteria bacterium]
MIGKLNHVAIVVPNLEAATALYRDALGAKVSEPLSLPEHGVQVVFVELPNTKVELLHPLSDKSPVAGFLEKNPGGGIHHMCYEVDDIQVAAARMRAEGKKILGDVKIGAHGKPVIFMHPKDFLGCLIELEQK